MYSYLKHPECQVQKSVDRLRDGVDTAILRYITEISLRVAIGEVWGGEKSARRCGIEIDATLSNIFA